MFNGNCLVSVNRFNTGTPEKGTGELPFILNVIAGKAPNRSVISYTVALNAGFKEGKTYLANCREVEPNEYGRQFRWSVVAEASSLVDIVDASTKLGNPVVFDVTTTASENIKATAEMFDAVEK